MWHDRETDTLVYDTPHVANVVQAIPAARHLHNGYVAVPRTLFNMQMLTWMGFPVTMPMHENYDWPRSRRLDMRAAIFRAQVLTANFLVLHPHGLTLSDMRTGKTLALLWAADFIMAQYPHGAFRFMINAPLSTLQRVWGDAIFNHFMGRRSCVILHGNAEKRRKLLAEPHDFYIINPDGLGTGVTFGKKRREVELRGFAADLVERTDIRGYIFDEISAYRNAGTERHKVARYWLSNREIVWGASGTPTPNSPTDAWGIAKLINNAGGESFTSFKGRTMWRITQFKWVPQRGSAQAARALLSPAIRFTQADVGVNMQSDIDPREIELSAAQTKALADLRRSAVLVVDGATIAPANEAVLRSKLIQIACGAVYSGTGSSRLTHMLDCAPRLQALRDLLVEASHKIIIFAPLTSVLTMLYSLLKERYKHAALVTGQITPKQRNEFFSKFQEAPEFGPLICDPGTIALGLDLSAARVTCWFGPTDKAETYQQANERVRGAGQKATSTTVVQFVSTTIERDIFHRLATKQSLQGVMLGLVNDGPTGLHR